jgi:hypothetical protein
MSPWGGEQTMSIAAERPLAEADAFGALREIERRVL